MILVPENSPHDYPSDWCFWYRKTRRMITLLTGVSGTGKLAA